MPLPTEWLLHGPPWVQYRARLDLLGQSPDDPQVRASRQTMLAHPQVRVLLEELSSWPGPPLRRHNDAGHPLHKLAFVADLGLCADDPGIASVVERIVACQSRAGAFQVIANISPSHGGSGQDQLTWMLCDAPSVLYALARLGLAEDERVRAAAGHLAGLIRENGWPCAVAPELVRFRGPGRKDDPCPYANLVALKALAQMPEWRDGAACRTAAETLLSLWERRKERRPYLFAMGTDFAKLKAPLIWYDILHVTDVLTSCAWLRQDPRLREMADIVKAKADEQGQFASESIWKAWQDWDFGQKRLPSPWLTLLAQRMLRRIEST